MLSHFGRHLPERAKNALKPYLAWVPQALRRGTVYRKWSRFLDSAQYWPHERIRAWQLEQLKAIITFAYRKTRGYRELYAQAGISPADIRSLDDARHLPFATKQLLRDNLEDFSVPSLLRAYVTTGGSTGIPFGFYMSWGMDEVEDAFVFRAWSDVGWRLGTRCAVLRGGFVGDENSPWTFDSYRNELLLSSYYLTSRTLDAYIGAIKRFKPPALQAYPSALRLLCDLLKDHGRVGEISFDMILLASENVYDWLIQAVEETFPAARLFDFYGHTERAIFAPWCQSSRTYHVWPYYGFTEILGPNGQEVAQGTEGELVGTSFHMRGTPFIRYRTEDRALKGSDSCPCCKRNFLQLDKIIGRNQEVIVTRTGRYISMTAMNMHSRVFDHLRQFQFYQDTRGEVEFRMVPKENYPEEETKGIYLELMKKLGEDVDLKLVFVDDIARTSAGKFRFLDQRLPIDYYTR